MKFIRNIEDANNSDINYLYLNRPEVKNAFHPEMIEEITHFFRTIKNKKLIILKGEGSVFCAGADLNWMKSMVNYSFEENIQDSEKLWDMFEAIMNSSCVTVGIAHGAVFGGALGLLAACDYVFSESKTKFCFSEVKLGLAPAVISSFIQKKCSKSHARALMLSAEVFDTEKAILLGLVHKKFENQLDESAIVDMFASNGIEGMYATKDLLNQLAKNPAWSEQKKLTTRVISERRMGPEAQARLKNFLTKN